MLLDDLAEQIQQLRHQAKFADAIPFAETTLSVNRRLRGDASWETADALRQVEFLRTAAALDPNLRVELAEADRADAMVEKLYADAKYDDAIELTRRQIEVRRKIFGNDHPDLATSLNNFAALTFAKGDLQAAIEQFRQALDLRRRLLGSEHPSVADGLNNLGFMYLQMGNYRLAQVTCDEAFQLYHQVLGDADERTATSLNNVAEALNRQARYEAAEPIYLRALAMRRRIHGEEHQLVAHALSNFALNLHDRGDYESAENYFRQALAILHRTVGEEHPDVATVLNNVARSANAQGRYAEAETLFRRALAMRQKLLGPDHSDTSTLLVNYARVLHVRGDFAAAESKYKEALGIQRKTLGDMHPDVALTLNNLGVLYRQRAEYDAATATYRDALAMQRQLLGDAHSDLAITMCNLAAVRHIQHDAKEAEGLYRGALKMRQDVLGTKHPDVAANMENLASFIVQLGDSAGYSEAESLFQKAIEILRESHDPYISVALTNYAHFLTRQLHRPQQAVPMFEEAIGYIEHLRVQIGGDELDRARFFTELDRADAFGGVVRALLMASDMQTDARADALRYLERGRGRALLDLLDRSGDDVYAVIFTLTEHARNDELKARIGSIRDRERDSRKACISLEARLSSLGSDPSIAEDDRTAQTSDLLARLDSAREEQRQAERDLFELASAEIGTRGTGPLNTKDVASLLRPGEILLAYDIGDQDSVLLSLTSDGMVTSFYLRWSDGDALTSASLKTAVNGLLESVTMDRPVGERAGDCDERHPPEDLISALVPKALDQMLARAKRVLVLPHRALYRLPFEALPIELASRTCWLDRYPPVVYAPSASVLLRPRQTKPKARTAPHDQVLLALGDAKYARHVERELPPHRGALIEYLEPNSIATSATLLSGDVILSYNEVEVESPANLLDAINSVTPSDDAKDENAKDAQIATVTVWRNGERLQLKTPAGPLGVRLSELSMPVALSVFRELSGTEQEARSALASARTREGFKDLARLPGTRNELNAISAILQRSGIEDARVKLLTGGDATVSNLFRTVSRPRFLHLATHGFADGGARVYESALGLSQPDQPTPDDDGFLRLRDLLYRWGGKLKGTELVVLSACDTARGPIESGEGVVALTWGFLFAGADSVIASLWKVDDTATALIMTRLYENLLGAFDAPRENWPAHTSMPKAEALAEAKRWLRSLRTSEVEKELVAISRGIPMPAHRPAATVSDRPFDDPRYWAAFILIGDPD